MLQKKRIAPTIGLKFLCMGSNCDITICQNHFARASLFLVGGDKVKYFLDKPHTIHTVFFFIKIKPINRQKKACRDNLKGDCPKNIIAIMFVQR